MGQVVQAVRLFRDVAAHRAAAHAALVRHDEPAGPEDVDRLIESAWAVVSWPVVDAILRRQRARAALVARC